MRYVKQFIGKIIVLVVLDQVVKLIISKWFMNQEFNIIGNIINFHPKQNTNLTWGGNFIGILSNMWVALFLNILVIIVLISGYSFYRSKKSNSSRSVNILYIFGMAGAICSLIDKMFWGGSLDFIQISQLFICDLKDCYLTVAECLFLVIGLKYEKEISVKEYVEYCFKKGKTDT